MRIQNRIWAVVLTLALLLAPASVVAVTGQQFGGQSMSLGQPDEVSIIFTHDMHSHLDADKIVENGETIEFGGMGRVSTTVNEIREQYPDSFLVDGGDFAMGTGYQTIFRTHATELKIMGMLGFDATTLGNHEFDYGPQGLADMLISAEESGAQVPALLCANIDWEASIAEAKDPEATQALKDAFEVYGVKDYVVVDKGGVRIAMFGIMGKEADSFAPTSGVIFEDPVVASKRVMKKIEKENVDMVICLSHSGTYGNAEESEDEILASEVSGIDLIVSGHTHTELQEPIVVKNTVIASCSAYNRYIGHVVFQKNDNDKYDMKSYELIPMDSDVPEDPAVLAALDAYREAANSEYFAQFGFKMDQVLAKNDVPFTPHDDFGDEKGEDTLGNIISDSYVYAVAKAEGPDSDPVDVAVVPSGVIRGTLYTGEITVSDAFNISSLGQGADGISGYPLVSAYITGRELRDLAEVDATVSDIMPEARLYMSGLKFDYNMHRMFLNRATDVQLMTADGLEDLEDDKLYRIVGDLYSCQMLSVVKGKSYGLLSLEPKDAEGNLITDFEEHIIYDGDRELKAWYALASYIDDFEGDKVPDKYLETEGRVNDVTSWNPIELVKQPNKIGYILMGVILLLILIIIGIVKLVKKIRRKRKANRPAQPAAPARPRHVHGKKDKRKKKK